MVIFMYPITISADFITKKQQKYLKKHGFEWDGLNFVGYFENEKEILKIKYYCQEHKLKFKINNSLGTRSTDYRRIFFKYNEPQLFGKYYICAYCGKWLKKEKLTVDHLYPVGKASKSLKYQQKLSRRGVKNINEPGNLLPACKNCNMRKSAKTGLWIFRGKIGRYKTLWIIRWILRLIIIALVVWFLWNSTVFWDIINYLKGVVEHFS